MTLNSALYPRRFYLSLALFCASVLATAFAVEYITQEAPCILCIIQRFLLGGLIMSAIFAAWTQLTWVHISARCFGIFCAFLGIAAALRQLWLMHHPEHIGGCGAALFYLVRHFPLQSIWTAVISGSSTCTHPPHVLGASLPAWSLAIFCIALIGLAFPGKLTKNTIR